MLKDCNNNITVADWEVTPNNNGNCIYYGCSTPGTGRITTGGFKPIPNCNWVGLFVTVKAYQVGTNNLLASFNTVIQDCDEIFEKENRVINEENPGAEAGIQGNSRKVALNLPADGPVEIIAINLRAGEKTELHQEAGTRGNQFSYMIPTDALTAGNFYFIRVQQNGKVLETRKIRLGGQ